MNKIYVIVPVFNELEHLTLLLQSWDFFVKTPCEILICNGNPGDSTTDYLSKLKKLKRHKVREVTGRNDLFWTGLVNLGLSLVNKKCDMHDYIILANADTKLQSDIVTPLVHEISTNRKLVISPLVKKYDGTIMSCGVIVRSWLFSVNHHLFRDFRTIPKATADSIHVTYLPARFLIFSGHALKTVNYPDAEKLPHYCADYEYTNRMRLMGFKPTVWTKDFVINDHLNSGFSAKQRETKFFSRVVASFEFKCSYNLIHRFNFVVKTYPKYALPTGLLSHFLKIAIEVVLGRKKS